MSIQVVRHEYHSFTKDPSLEDLHIGNLPERNLGISTSEDGQTNEENPGRGALDPAALFIITWPPFRLIA